jgi:hypothetical protein
MFDNIKKKVVDRFDILSKGELFEVDLDRDILFNTYLASLPEEERQPHNCNCCKTFKRFYK